MSGIDLGGTMDAWGHWAAGTFGRDPPQISDAERERLCAWHWGIVKVIRIFAEPLLKGFIIGGDRAIGALFGIKRQ
jgi:hypothetical protein